ncbi:MAG: isocitrate/isopropylmalate family dehydrogenase [bacterium]|nr:isocitrate/isopropylmalate family dehydrogenase [bacterium]
MKEVPIALVTGDGSAPEMMVQATTVAVEAAKKDDVEIRFIKTPMGWNAYQKYGDTFPAESFRVATKLGLLFFGGVGDTEYDKTIGKEHPEMLPEARSLLTIRNTWKLLLNFRPVIYYKALAHLARVKISQDDIPEAGIEQIFIRFLLQDSYFGTIDLIDEIPQTLRQKLGIKTKAETTGNEEIVTELAYYTKSTVETYFRAAFHYAKAKGLPLICAHKKNVMARYVLWSAIANRIAQKEFPEVEFREQLIDSGNALLFHPEKLHGVIACGNEHGDILSDGAVEAVGSMGLMCSSAINPITNQAMFESGAGTAPTLKGQDKANPIGRILTAAMMLRHIGAQKGAKAIENAVNTVLQGNYRTLDLTSKNDNPNKILGTKAMGEKILYHL